MVRRDFTNESGYFCPTENAAIREMSRPKPYTPKPSPSVMHEKDLRKMDARRVASSAPVPGRKDDRLAKMRRLYAAICDIAAMIDVSIVSVEFKCKDDESRYRTTGATRLIERVRL